MQNIVIFGYLGIAIVMVIAAFILGRRSSNSNSHTNHNTTNASDFIDIGANDAHHDHNGNADHSTSKGISHVDSGS